MLFCCGTVKGLLGPCTDEAEAEAEGRGRRRMGGNGINTRTMIVDHVMIN